MIVRIGVLWMARKGKMYDKSIHSKFLEEEMVLKIYEPEQYNNLYDSHIVIMQDGNDYFQMGRVATISDRMHDDYELSNTVFVGIHYVDRFDRLKKYAPDGEQFEAYKQFLKQEVVPMMEEICPINPLGTTYSLMGDSLAGTIALMTAVEFPNIFTKVIMQSPLVDEHVLDAANQLDAETTMEIYHSIGLNETAVGTTSGDKVDFVTPNKQLSSILDKKIRYYDYVEIENGNHTWKYWQQEIPTIFEKMFM